MADKPQSIFLFGPLLLGHCGTLGEGNWFVLLWLLCLSASALFGLSGRHTCFSFFRANTLTRRVLLMTFTEDPLDLGNIVEKRLYIFFAIVTSQQGCKSHFKNCAFCMF